MANPTLVVFSHLRWDFVFQRPQHLMIRFAATRSVLFIEEPVITEGRSRWEFRTPVPGVTVCRPHTNGNSVGFSDEQNKILEPMIKDLLASLSVDEYDLWFYSPLAFPLTRELNPGVIVYDNMDDLTAFKNASPQLRNREEELLVQADVVFTGGPSLYRAMKDRHSNVNCFSSSVDIKHFAQAATGLSEPPQQSQLPWPRLGFFGVIDERFDISLLEAVADARPQWQFVMVGPVVKIDPATLPKRSNIHYFGSRSYEELPSFLSGWDVALILFARNESTKRISPTKVLEYMAAEKPIISTRITDIVEPYGSMVQLADEPQEFIAAAEAILAENLSDRKQRAAKYHEVLSQTSWDTTVEAMANLMELSRTKESDLTTSKRELSNTVERSRSGSVVIIGAGPTGLSAAYHLGEDALVLEANDSVGGWCRSVQDNGFTFDWAGHIMFSNEPYVHEMYQMLLGDNVHWQDREAWIYSKNVHTRYPFQGSLYGLPADVIRECIMGAIEARFGRIKKEPASTMKHAEAFKKPTNGKTNGAVSESRHHTITKIKDSPGGPPAPNGYSNGKLPNRINGCFVPGSDPKDFVVKDCCGDGVAESTLSIDEKNSPETKSDEPKNFEEFIHKVWGAGIAKHFAIPYNRKIWAVPLHEMETSWLGGRVPLPDLEEMIEGALTQKPKPMGPNARFGYPLRGGFQALMNGFLPLLKGDVLLNSRVSAISAKRKVVTLQDGTNHSYSQLVSTMPLPALIRAMGDEVPDEVKRAASALRYTSVRCVNLGIGREKLTEKHWIYYPEDTVFHRIFVQGNASPHCNPPGGFGLTCEITYGPLKPLPCDDKMLIQRCIEDCIKVGLFNTEDPILAANQVDMPFAYVIYDHARPQNVAIIREFLDHYNIHLAGRYSEWEYYNSDHAFLAGKKIAERVRHRLSKRELVLT